MKRQIIRPRPDWKAQAEQVGFTFHHMGGQLYWDERAWYEFTLEQAETVETAVTKRAARRITTGLPLPPKSGSLSRKRHRVAVVTRAPPHSGTSWATRVTPAPSGSATFSSYARAGKPGSGTLNGTVTVKLPSARWGGEGGGEGGG